MRKGTLAALCLCMACAASGALDISIEGCATTKLTSFAGRAAWLDGGGTRLVIHHRMLIGAGGCRSLVNPLEPGYGGMYGGLWVEYQFLPRSPLRFSLGTILGVGAMGRVDPETGEYIIAPHLVMDPNANLVVQVTEFLSFAVGAGWRLAIPLRAVEDIGPVERRLRRDEFLEGDVLPAGVARPF